MDRRTQARLRALLISCSLISAAACSDTGTITDAPIAAVDAASFSRAAASGTAAGVALKDTSVAVNSALRIYWYEPTVTYAISGRNRIALPPAWVVKDSSVLTLNSASGMYANVTAKAAGTTFLVGALHGRKDSVQVTVTSAVVPPVGNTPTTPGPRDTVVTTSGTPAPPVTPVPPAPPAPPTGSALAYNAPIPPQATVSTTYPTITGASRRVISGGDLQAALNAAQPGDEVVLANGATFTGNFVLPAKTGNAWIVVRAETVPVSQGTRMTPTAASNVAKVITPNNDAAFSAAPGAAHWRMVGFEVSLTGSIYNYGIVVLGRGDETLASQLASFMILDRMYIHGSTTSNTSRCIAMNGISEAVVDSWLGECHAKGFDSQGVGGWGGPGPFLIENNRIEASGQSILFGGSDPLIANVVPSDITIRHNYMFKPLSWGNGLWTVKAVLELKMAQRVLFEGNVIENHWADAQAGYAILMQPSQDAANPWAVVRDVLIQHNLFKNSTGGMDLLARYQAAIPIPTSRIALVNNMFQDVGKDPINGGQGRIVLLLDAVQDITILNNTVTLNGSCNQAIGFAGNPTVRTTIVNNVLPSSDYGLFGDGKGSGNPAVSYYMPGGILTANVITGQSAGQYPTNNFFPSTSSSIQFQSAVSGNFSLSNANPFYSGAYGLIGVSYTELASHILGVTH
jgi:hypothetical protein